MKPADQLAHEQRRRAEVEALLEQTQAELCAAYRKLDDHAQNVSVQIIRDGHHNNLKCQTYQ